MSTNGKTINGNGGENGTILVDGQNASNGEPSKAKRHHVHRSKAGSVRSCILELSETGWLDRGKTCTEMRKELSKNGNNFQLKDVATIAQRLTRQRVLSRTKNKDGVYVYIMKQSA